MLRYIYKKKIPLRLIIALYSLLFLTVTDNILGMVSEFSTSDTKLVLTILGYLCILNFVLFVASIRYIIFCASNKYYIDIVITTVIEVPLFLHSLGFFLGVGLLLGGQQ